MINPSEEATALLGSFLEGLQAGPAEVFVIAGNHDPVEKLSFLSGVVDKAGLHIVTAFHGVLEKRAVGDADIYMLPYIRTVDVRPFFPEEEIASVGDAVRLSAIADHDIEALGRQLAQVGILVSSLDKEHRSCDVRLENISRALERFMADEAEAEVLRHRWASLKELADVANGNLSGEDRLSLETYVQTRYLDRILRRANGKLLAMTNGQYEMERSGEGRGRRRKMGLDIDVMDHFTGKSRAASTLSGGEGFKASLALALGLSEEIQAQAGAIRIETMFVDEGFGTLDDESLASALSTLSGLASSGRLVGVISHVAELKGRIDRQILVEKGRADGSTVRLKC